MLCCSAGEFFSRFAIQILTHGDAIFVLIVFPTSVSNFCQESQIILFENVIDDFMISLVGVWDDKGELNISLNVDSPSFYGW